MARCERSPTAQASPTLRPRSEDGSRRMRSPGKSTERSSTFGKGSRGREGRDHPAEVRRRPRHDPPLDRPPDGDGSPGALPGHSGDDRPRDRERILLRLRHRSPVHRRGPPSYRGKDAGARQEGPADPARRVEARRRGRRVREDGRGLQGRDHQGNPRRRDPVGLPAGRVEGPLPRAARPVDRPARRVQTAVRCRRVLARRREERDAAAHLRHRVGRQEGARGLPQAGRRGKGARPPQARQGARAHDVLALRAGDADLPSEGRPSSTTR